MHDNWLSDDDCTYYIQRLVCCIQRLDGVHKMYSCTFNYGNWCQSLSLVNVKREWPYDFLCIHSLECFGRGRRLDWYYELPWMKEEKKKTVWYFFHVDLHVDNRLTFVQANNRKMQNNYKIIIKKQGHFDTVQHQLHWTAPDWIKRY